MLAVLFLFSCSGPATPPIYEAPPSAEPAHQTVADIVAEKDKPKVTKINPDELTTALAPEEAITLEWDFSKNEEIRYEYVQRGLAKGRRNNEIIPKQEQFIEGVVRVRSLGDGTALLVMKEMNANLTGEAYTTFNWGSPNSSTLYEVSENGLIDAGNDDGELFSHFMFPLPPKPTKVGTSIKLPVETPFDAAGTTVYATGETVVTLSRLVELESGRAAEIKTETKVPPKHVSQGVVGSHSLAVTSSSVFYFDLETRAFIAGYVDLTMALESTLPGSMVIEGQRIVMSPTPISMRIEMTTEIELNRAFDSP
ncbi:MAG: hypothetical protein HN348_32320 [Proteobacteria bacterium]|nr:hypothetical protein [Pseudomonadota bacterium]